MDYFTKGVDSTIDELEKEFADGLRVLRIANNVLDDKRKEKLVRYIEFIIKEETTKD